MGIKAKVMIQEAVRQEGPTPVEIYQGLERKHMVLLMMWETAEGARRAEIEAELEKCKELREFALYAVYKWAIEEKA